MMDKPHELTALTDKIHGSLAGLALGDALGMPTEFLTPEQIHAAYGWVDRLRVPADDHYHRGLPAGRVTDDTGQALALCRAYLHHTTFTPEAVAAELLAWADGEPDLAQMIGPNTAAALERLRRGEDPRQTGHAGGTNGAAMRAPIVGLAHPGDPEGCLEDVIAMCLPTHGTRPGIAGAAAVAFATAEALRPGATLPGILDAAGRGAVAGGRHGAWKWSTPLEKRIDLARRVVTEAMNPKAALRGLYETVGVDMLVAESVASAFGILLLADGDPFAAVRYGANIGGDTDTIAAIAGAVCGAWRGIAALPRGLVREVEAVNRLDLARLAADLAQRSR